MPRDRPSFQHAGFFGFRTPLLPLAEFRAWSEDLQAASLSENPDAFRQAYERDRQILREPLRQLVTRPEILEALQVASPNLVDSLPRWMSDPDGEKGQRTELALVRYFARMCHRPTPFGLFASHGMGRTGTASCLEVPPLDQCVRRSRLDMSYLHDLAAAAWKSRGLRRTLRFRLNTSLYRLGGRVRLAETIHREGVRMHNLVSLEEDACLRAVLAAAEAGATLDQLAGALAESQGVEPEVALAYVHDLIDNQALVPDLEPPLTGPDPAQELMAKLAGDAETLGWAEALGRAREILGGLDARGLGGPIEAYAELVGVLRDLPAEVDRGRLVQVDLFRSSPALSLGPAAQAAIAAAVQVLGQVSLPPADPLAAFREAFLKRYDQRWVPLAEALDPEGGVGFSGAQGSGVVASPLLNGIALTDPVLPRDRQETAFSARDAYLLRLLGDLKAAGRKVLELGSVDLEALAQPAPAPLPHSFQCMVELAGDSPEALEQGVFQILLHEGGGPSAARLFGRFCDGDPSLRREVEAHLRAEEACRPHAVFAEIVHLPQARAGNVARRPVLRAYEMPFLARSGADPDRWLRLEDLFVGLEGDRVVLWSKRLDREVVPRLSSALNYSTGVVDLYRFLGCLQDQGLQSSLGFSWGALAREPWLPRVVHGRVILARAQWRLAKSQLRSVAQADGPAGRFHALKHLQSQLALPRWLLLADGDNELPLDLDNPLMLEAFWGIVRTREEATLVEDFPGSQGLLATGPEGAYAQELILPFLATTEVPETALLRRVLTDAPILHGPGSEWLYAKLYTGQHTAEKALAGPIARLVEAMLDEGLADRWFFIRYADPEPHLRLRFHGRPDRLWREGLQRLRSMLDPLLRDGWIWRFQLDCYEPEWQRYGGGGNQERTEQVFQADSETAIAIASCEGGDQALAERWVLALASVDGYFNSAGLDLPGRLKEVGARCAEFRAEYRQREIPLHRQAARKFREERRRLESLFEPSEPKSAALATGLDLMRRRHARIQPLFAAMREELAAVGNPVETLLASFIHMSVNRLLPSAQRIHEAFIYEFLERLYRARTAQESAWFRPGT